MIFFSSKYKLNKKNKELKEEIKQLRAEGDKQLEDIAGLREQVAKILNENRAYEKKYVYTNLECQFCYTTLQEEFVFCPKCGKKIETIQKIDTNIIASDFFQTEADGNYLLINQYNGFSDKKIVIPSAINGKPVIGIWNGVFEKCTELEEVIFEEGCKYIGNNAFANCTKLKKVRLPKSLLEIGDRAFCECALEELAVPSNVKVIGKYAFSSRSLKKIILPDKLKFISDGMLCRTSIEEIDLPQSITHIGAYAFDDTRIRKIELPYNLYSIANYAFSIPVLKEITIHSNVEIIEKDVFGKSTKPMIHCAAGSKGHLYARKYGIPCSEIPSQPTANIQVCASGIILELGSVTLGEKIGEWYRFCGMTKAETWSWNAKKRNTLYIEKCMNMEEAFRIKRALQNYVNSHSDWSTPGMHCSLRELSICKHWGKSAV